MAKQVDIHEETEATKSDRSPRSAESRDKQSRAKPWQPPSLLDAPEPPDGYVHRWINDGARRQSEYV